MLRFHDHHDLSALLDYVDAPAQEVLDRTARSKAQRMSDETRAELDKVLRRVENIYGSLEMLDQAALNPTGSNVEYVNDMRELEEILRDNLKKKKYQQQVTIFVVGYENVCSSRLRLIQQVNEFFMETNATLSADLPEEPTEVEDSDQDEELFNSLNSQMEESIESCHQLSVRLAEVNREMVDFMAAYAQSKANNNKQVQQKSVGGKKKLEKSLEKAQSEMTQLSEKLLNTQEDLQEKEDRIQQLYKQMEMKNIECQKYKTAAEAMKKSAMDMDSLKETLSKKDLEIRMLQSKLSELSIEITENEEVTELGNEKMREVGEMSKQKINQLETQLQSKNLEMADTQRDIIGEMMEMQKRFEEKINELQQEHKVEIEAMKRDHENHIKFVKHGGESRGSQFDENAVTKWMSDDEEEAVYKSKSQSRLTSPNIDEELKSIRDDEDDSHKQRASVSKDGSRMTVEVLKTPRSRATQESDVLEFNDTFELEDEKAWSSIPRHHLLGRFNQYRELSETSRNSLTEKLDAVKKVTDRKVQTLKGQFQEHKARWLKERDILLHAIHSSETHREAAQGFAEKAVDQMESLIATAEQQESMAPLTEPSERESVMKARVNFLEITNAELQEKLERTEEIAHNLEAQLYDKAREKVPPDGDEEQPGAPSTRSASTKSKKVTITSAYETGGTRQSSGLSSQLSDARQTVVETRYGLARSDSTPSRAAVASATQRLSESLGEGVELDENADMPFPPDPTGWPVDDRNTAVSTASSLLRKEIPLADHPIVQEYVRTYDHLMEFKEKLGSLLQDRELMTHASNLYELETMTLKKDAQIAPQVEEMGRSIVMVLDQTLVLVRHMLTTSDRDYPVSSLRLSDLESSTFAGESQRAGSRTTMQTLPAVSEHPGEAERLRAELADLHQKYNELKAQFDASNKKYEEQLNQNTSIMLEMQGTITNLKRELTSINAESTGRRSTSAREANKSRPKSSTAAPTYEAQQTEVPEPSIIFTRLDFERNAKSLKRAVAESRLDAESYQDALQKMEAYTRIPAQRLGIIARKYLHHHTMLQIQENARRHKSVNTELFQLWDNMELLEMKRNQRYAEVADYLTAQRLRLAGELVDKFESLEERCSIFLIKPVLSLKSREQLKDYYASIMRMKENEARQRLAQEEQERKQRAKMGVHPTPEVTRVSMNREMPSHLKGNSLKEPTAAPAPTFWNPMAAQNAQNYLSDSLTTINTPRLLEMDVNRVLLGQNNVSVTLPEVMPPTAPPQMSVRTYISVARPSSQPKMAYMYDVNLNDKDKPGSGRKPSQSQKVPPSTPLDRRGPLSAGSAVTKDLSGHPPLPPITPTPRADREDDDEEETVDEAFEEQEEAPEDIPVDEETTVLSRPQSAVLSVTVSPRTQPLSSVAFEETREGTPLLSEPGEEPSVAQGTEVEEESGDVSDDEATDEPVE